MQRTTTRSVTFARPFMLDDLEDIHPAGTYVIETEEEQIEQASFLAWRRVSVAIVLKSAGTEQHVTIDPQTLENALQRDAAPAVVETPTSKVVA